MHKYLPSKRFSLILLSIIIALIIIWIFPLVINLVKPKSAGVLLTGSAAQDKIQEFMALDSDSDGLKDWEEALYKTDPKNPDTDSDGTVDGEEVKINRDPLKANTAKKDQEPNDKIDAGILAAEKKKEEAFNNLSATDKMGRMMFSQYLATKKVGQNLTTDDISNIVQNTLTNMPSVSFKQYALTELKISSSADPETIKKYGNDISEIILNNLFDESLVGPNNDIFGLAKIQDLMLTMQSATGDNTAVNQAFAKLDPVINRYQTTVASLLAINAPGNWADSHLNLINATELVFDNLTQIRRSQSNLAVLPILLADYSNNATNFFNTLITLGKTFDQQHIIFTATDFGYRLFSGTINQ